MWAVNRTRRASALGQLILHLHERAKAEGNIRVREKEATRVLDVLRYGYRSRYYRRAGTTENAGVTAGVELRQGMAQSALARTIRQSAIARLRDYAVFMVAVDTLGYSPQLLRAALSIHWERLASAEMGSDGNCVRLDIEVAVAALDTEWKTSGSRHSEASGMDAQTPRPSDIVSYLQQGYGPQEIGKLYDTNGSRLVGRLLKALSNKLGGISQ